MLNYQREPFILLINVKMPTNLTAELSMKNSFITSGSGPFPFFLGRDHINIINSQFVPKVRLNEPRSEKTGLRGYRPGPKQTRLYSHRRWLEA